MIPNFPFRFSRSDVALVVELYLPKRAQYQALLLQVLSGWYEWERKRDVRSIKSHFELNRNQILELLEHYSSLRTSYDAICESFPLGLAVGHSVYEVDGFFANAETPAVAEWAKAMFAVGGARPKQVVDTPKASDGGFAAEERTLVVRFIFPFPERVLVDQATEALSLGATELRPLFREAIRGFLQTPAGHRPEEYTRRLLADPSYSGALKKLAGDQEAIAEAHIETLVRVTDSWIHCVALWLFGYLVLKVTSGMNELVVRGELEKNEDEIWITSFWDVALNRILPSTKSTE
ncbi:MAG TPA: hypothetical protein VF789_11055 [Thermoanaerobaculia bacterium]